MEKLLCHGHVMSSLWSPMCCLVLGLQIHRESVKDVTEQLKTGDREHGEPWGHAARQSCGQGSQEGQRLQIWTRTLPNAGQAGLCIAQRDFPSLAPQVTLVLCSHRRENPQKGGPSREAGARPGGERERERRTEQPQTSTHMGEGRAGSTQHHVAPGDTTKKNDAPCIESGRAAATGSRLRRVQVCTAAPAAPLCRAAAAGEASGATGDKYFEPPVK